MSTSYFRTSVQGESDMITFNFFKLFDTKELFIYY